MQRFARWHIWLGWLVGFPILMWTVTGLVMVAKPIEEVRGENLRAPAAAVDPTNLKFPTDLGQPIREARLVAPTRRWSRTRRSGSRWRPIPVRPSWSG
jgi:uncharacterized iron-regulated membrane protein